MANNTYTKAQKYDNTIAIIEGRELPHIIEGVPFSAIEAVAFLAREREALSRKNTGKSKKDTEKEAKDNERMKMILDFLSTMPDGANCTEIGNGVPALNELNTPTISSLMQKLKKAGSVDKKTVKGRSHYFLA